MLYHKGHYFILSSMLLIRTSSQMCAYVFVKGWIIDPYEHWFFNQPREIMLFPAHYTEVV